MILEGGGRLDALFTRGVGLSAGFQHLAHAFHQSCAVRLFRQAFGHGGHGAHALFQTAEIVLQGAQFSFGGDHAAKSQTGGFSPGEKGGRAFRRRHIADALGQHELMPAAAGLLDSAFHFVGLALQNAHLSLGQAHLALQRLHVPEGTFFVETLLAFALQKHFRGFQGDEIHTLHTRRGAELAGLLAQFGHVQGAGLAAALQLRHFPLVALASGPLRGRPPARKPTPQASTR